jgi:squalene-hopene/tetraprenyl-beta-curcumene cyclase
MKPTLLWMNAILIAVFTLPSRMNAAEPITLANVTPQAPITSDEPRVTEFSLQGAAGYLDTAALNWQKAHACTACHTMIPYMMARPALQSISPQSAEVRHFFEEIAAGTRQAMPNYSCNDVDGAVAIVLACALAINDRESTGTLHPLTRQALDRMWTLQREDGSWQWPFRDTPPLKITEHYGVTLAAIAAGMAPSDYAQTSTAQTGLKKVRQYFRNNKPVSLHEKAMLLWASSYVGDLLSNEQRQEILGSLMSAQRADGGWSLASLVDNTCDPSLGTSDRAMQARAEPGYGSEFLAYVGREKNYRSMLVSDGYATGFAVFVARQAGLAASDAHLQRGVQWLKQNQRQSGRWFTPSQSWHQSNLISNAGTAYAVMALEACGQVP